MLRLWFSGVLKLVAWIVYDNGFVARCLRFGRGGVWLLYFGFRLCWVVVSWLWIGWCFAVWVVMVDWLLLLCWYGCWIAWLLVGWFNSVVFTYSLMLCVYDSSWVGCLVRLLVVGVFAIIVGLLCVLV